MTEDDVPSGVDVTDEASAPLYQPKDLSQPAEQDYPSPVSSITATTAPSTRTLPSDIDVQTLGSQYLTDVAAQYAAPAATSGEANATASAGDDATDNLGNTAEGCDEAPMMKLDSNGDLDDQSSAARATAANGSAWNLFSSAATFVASTTQKQVSTFGQNLGQKINELIQISEDEMSTGGEDIAEDRDGSDIIEEGNMRSSGAISDVAASAVASEGVPDPAEGWQSHPSESDMTDKLSAAILSITGGPSSPYLDQQRPHRVSPKRSMSTLEGEREGEGEGIVAMRETLEAEKIAALKRKNESLEALLEQAEDELGMWRNGQRLTEDVRCLGERLAADGARLRTLEADLVRVRKECEAERRRSAAVKARLETLEFEFSEKERALLASFQLEKQTLEQRAHVAETEERARRERLERELRAGVVVQEQLRKDLKEARNSAAALSAAAESASNMTNPPAAPFPCPVGLEGRAQAAETERQLEPELHWQKQLQKERAIWERSIEQLEARLLEKDQRLKALTIQMARNARAADSGLQKDGTNKHSTSLFGGRKSSMDLRGDMNPFLDDGRSRFDFGILLAPLSYVLSTPLASSLLQRRSRFKVRSKIARSAHFLCLSRGVRITDRLLRRVLPTQLYGFHAFALAYIVWLHCKVLGLL